MEPVTLAITAASLIAAKIADRLGSDAAAGVSAAVGRVFDVVRRRFEGDEEFDGALTRLEEKPESEARAREIAELLEARIQQDPNFADELARLVDEAEATQGDTRMVTIIRDQARVGKVTTIGTVQGDVRF